MLTDLWLLSILLIAQADQVAEATRSVPPAAENWWQIFLHQPLALALLLIFLTAIISTLVVSRMKDKCLKLLHNHHVTYLAKSGRAIWGDLVVYPEGIEL